MSDFDSDTRTGIDFDEAVMLSAGGSTCDIYRTRWQRRDVFVKRLKEKYRSMPLYLDALDKEFDIGVRLRHRSLPEYREFHRDYIVMDYIDGLTLAEMLRRKDPWLSSEKNIARLLTELVDVVEYLHRHNVVHCDIKPDNIIITANNSNLVLIDFDKSYTDSLNNTSGHPAKYGLTVDDRGKSAIDFHAIGMLVERLRREVAGFKFSAYRKFVRACYNTDANCEQLKEILASNHSKTRALKLALRAIALIIAVVALVTWIARYRSEKPVNQETIVTQEPTEKTDCDTAIIKPDNVHVTSPAPAHKTQQELHYDANEKAATLDRRIQPSFNELLADLDRLNTLKNDESLSGQQLLDNIRRHGDLADEYITEAFEILKESFPGTTDREAWRIMAYSKAYTGYTRRATPELRALGQEVERRFAAETTEITK